MVRYFSLSLSMQFKFLVTNNGEWSSPNKYNFVARIAELEGDAENLRSLAWSLVLGATNRDDKSEIWHSIGPTRRKNETASWIRIRGWKGTNAYRRLNLYYAVLCFSISKSTHAHSSHICAHMNETHSHIVSYTRQELERLNDDIGMGRVRSRGEVRHLRH